MQSKGVFVQNPNGDGCKAVFISVLASFSLFCNWNRKKQTASVERFQPMRFFDRY